MMNNSQTIKKIDITALWIFRILTKCEGYKKFIDHQYSKPSLNNDDVAKLLGFSEYISDFNVAAKVFELDEIRNLIFQKAHEAELLEIDLTEEFKTIKNNIGYLTKLLNLNQCESDFLFFLCVSQQKVEMETAFDYLGKLSQKKTTNQLAKILNFSVAEISAIFQINNILFSSGLIESWFNLSDFHSIGKEVFPNVMLSDLLLKSINLTFENPGDIFNSFFRSSCHAQLDTNHYPHMDFEINLISNYLNEVNKSHAKGVNILLYGPTGTGKTEFVRMLSKHCKQQLFEIASELEYSEHRNRRFIKYMMGQTILQSKSDAWILFDEVEDVFSANDIRYSNASGLKAWVNQFLENNPSPAFWITNNIDCFDHAYIRRFDFVIEMKSPPKAVRKEILNRYLVDLTVSEVWKDKIVENQSLSPAIIERAVKVIQESRSTNNESETEYAIEYLLKSTINAIGGTPLTIKSHHQSEIYRPEFFNTDMDIDHICDGLDEFKQGRICLYGPPGTGKTSFSYYIAHKLNKPLVSFKASDIIDMYLGQTEKNIASMFQKASSENAILVLDEADTFLFSRTNAKSTWEISGVNEMLMQIESFTGIFIAASNFIDSMDIAAMRRFDLKLKFNYLNKAQVNLMFQMLLEKYHLNLSDKITKELETFDKLTLGDFATVKRALHFTKKVDIETLVEMLKKEFFLKSGINNRRIGFN